MLVDGMQLATHPVRGKQGKAKAELEALSNVLSTTYGDPVVGCAAAVLTVRPSSRNACASGLL